MVAYVDVIGEALASCKVEVALAGDLLPELQRDLGKSSCLGNADMEFDYSLIGSFDLDPRKAASNSKEIAPKSATN